ncbi:glycosyltransferase family 4 protein [Patescibacteria group bacterium]|nr:glycosyltransferase family 4 protein [Patescibacteria group bacterium]
MLTPYLPYPPSSGGQVRSYNLIKNLAKDHQITLFSLIKDNNELKYIKELEKFCRKVKVFKRPEKPWTLRNILRTGFSLYPFLVIRNLVPEEKEAVEKELKKEDYDLIHAETFYVMPHIPKTKVPILLVEQTIEYQVYQHYVQSKSFWLLKQLLNIDVAKIKFWETKFWQKANKVVAVSDSDKRKMQSLVKGLDVDVVPNGAGEDLVSLWQDNKKFTKVIVLFQANFLWLQNTEAAIDLVKKIFPLIKKMLPQAVCRIVGQEAHKKLAGIKGRGIEIVDLSNDDIEGVKKAYRQATVFLAPLTGPGGTRLKILGAMAAGVPVVTTPVGIEGIDAKDGVQVLVRKSEKELAEAVVELIKNKKLYQKVSRAARTLIEKTYTYKAIAAVLDKIYRQVGSYGKN